jgi:hypothetical protein
MNKTNRQSGQHWIGARMLNLVVCAAFALSLFSFCITNNAQEIASSPVQDNITDVGPSSLTVTGPKTGELGKPLTMIVEGLPEINIDDVLKEQVKWVESIRFAISKPDGSEVELDKELAMTVAPFSWRLRVTIVPDELGTYVVVCDWNLPPYGLALHRVDVRGPPTPPIPPVPPVPPVPPGPEPGPDPPQPPTSGVVMMVMVKPDQPTADQFEQFLKLRTWVDEASRLDKVALWEVTKGQQDSSGDLDANLAAYINLVPENETLPYLFITQKITNGNGTTILWKGEYNANVYQDVVDKVNQLIQ